MKSFACFALFFAVSVASAQSVKGQLRLLAPAQDCNFIVRNTKVVLVTDVSRDTVSLNDRLEFEFPNAKPGKAFLYLSSPVLPSFTQYKFRVRKHKRTSVSLIYDRFEADSRPRVKTPEEREAEVETGIFLLRLAADLAIIIQSLKR